MLMNTSASRKPSSLAAKDVRRSTTHRRQRIRTAVGSAFESRTPELQGYRQHVEGGLIPFGSRPFVFWTCWKVSLNISAKLLL